MDTNVSLPAIIEPRPGSTRSEKAAATEPERSASAPAGESLPLAEPEAMDSDALADAVRKLNEHVQNLQRSLQFSVDDDTGRTVITVLDSVTKEVIRQIPSEETLRILSRLNAATGLLLSAEV